MSVYTVARDDFKNARRSYIVLGVVGVFAAFVGLIFASEISIYDNPYRTLFDVSALIAFAFPLFLAPLTYLAIAGDRESGAIKYAMGLPNSRGEYFLGKLFSRLGVGLAAVVLGVLVGFAIALAAFTNAPELTRFLWFAAVSLLFTFSFVGLFVAVSASTAKRSRAMLGVFGLYFLFVPFWFQFFPVVSLGTVVDAVASTLGVSLSETTRGTIFALSPATAYLDGTEVVYQGVIQGDQTLMMNFEGDEFYNQLWFNALVMAAWGTLGLLVGFLKFRKSELG